jgi:hypothetical protein
LPDPLNDRPVKDLAPFVNKAIADDLLFHRDSDGSEKVDWKLFEEFISKEGPLIKSQVMRMLKLGISIFKKEPNLVHIPEPIVVVGDIHG